MNQETAIHKLIEKLSEREEELQAVGKRARPDPPDQDYKDYIDLFNELFQTC